MHIKNALKTAMLTTLLLICALLFSGQALAEENYNMLAAKMNVPCGKVWNVKFNESIDPSTINASSIMVTDASGNIFPVKLDYNPENESVTVTPENKYESGKTYNLIIGDIKSASGSILKQPCKMPFTIESGSALLPESEVAEKVDAHTYEIEDIITLYGTSGSSFRLTYNLGTPSSSYYQKEIKLNAYGQGAAIIDTPDGTKQLVINSSIQKGGKSEYRIVRTIENSGVKYLPDLSKTSGDYTNFKDYSKYTGPTERIQSTSPEIIKKSEEIFKGITDPYFKAKKAFEFVNSYMTYDIEYGNKGALSALRTGRGVCEDYAELFTALLRASGVPARVVTGFWIDPDEFDSDTMDADNYRHAWPEFYLPEYGWIVAEPTFEDYYNDVKQIDYNKFANLSFPGHFIEGYNVEGEYVDGEATEYDFEDIVLQGIRSYIHKLN